MNFDPLANNIVRWQDFLLSHPTRFCWFIAGVDAESLLWVDKYSPKCIKQIIGQQGEKSNVKKLLRWLQNWHSNRKRGKAKGGIQFTTLRNSFIFRPYMQRIIVGIYAF